MRNTLSKLYVRYRSLIHAVAAVAAVALVKTAAAHAGTDATFDDLNTMMTDWSKGSSGKALALIALLLGIGTAAARQSFAALFGGIGVAAGAVVGPDVISTVVSATF